jgi:hypothetical protein
MTMSQQFESITQELAATQQATEELLREVAAADGPDEHAFIRLDKLATACAKLAYGNGLASLLSDNVISLIAWCDHLDDSEWKAKFASALKSYPLRSPW